MNDDTFFSMNRLVEFGLSLAVAQQMIGTMNNSLRNTYVPGPQNPMVPNRIKNYHVIIDGKPAGPFSEQELSRLISEGKVVKDTYVWMPGMPKWNQAENVADVLRLVALSPPPFNPEG